MKKFISFTYDSRYMAVFYFKITRAITLCGVSDLILENWIGQTYFLDFLYKLHINLFSYWPVKLIYFKFFWVQYNDTLAALSYKPITILKDANLANFTTVKLIWFLNKCLRFKAIFEIKANKMECNNFSDLKFHEFKTFFSSIVFIFGFVNLEKSSIFTLYSFQN